MIVNRGSFKVFFRAFFKRELPSVLHELRLRSEKLFSWPKRLAQRFIVWCLNNQGHAQALGISLSLVALPLAIVLWLIPPPSSQQKVETKQFTPITAAKAAISGEQNNDVQERKSESSLEPKKLKKTTSRSADELRKQPEPCQQRHGQRVSASLVTD